MTHVDELIGLLAAVAVLAGVARLLDIPYPIVLVLGGLGAGFLPGVPAPSLSPEVVFLVFLPPLVFAAAFGSSVDELRSEAGLILTLAVGLVLATMVAVAVGAHALLHLGWGPAFVLGAIVAPTDPLAATAIISRLGAPARLGAILEGEALVNDGTGLTVYTVALASVTAGGFSAPEATGRFVVVALGGAALGLAVGWLSARLRRALDAPDVELTISLLTPFVAYIPADRLGLSGVLAAVAAGLYVGRQATTLSSSDTRLRTRSFWDALEFLLNALLFLLIGLQFPAVVGRLSGLSPGVLAAQAALVFGLVVGARVLWMLAAAPGLAALSQRLTGHIQPLPVRQRAVMGWSGMRGGVSLAAALAVPLTAQGHPFPGRDALLFLTMAVVLGTLVLPGLTLAPLIRALGLAQGKARRRQDAETRIALAHAALERIEALARDDGLSEETASRLRAAYEVRLSGLQEVIDDEGESGSGAGGLAAVRQARRTVIDHQRRVLADLHREGRVPADLQREIEHDLDLEEARL